MGRDVTIKLPAPVEAYHTALTGGRQEAADPVTHWSGPNCVALQHDVLHPLPAPYALCDVLYSDPPWRSGYDEFNRRAGVTDAIPYPDFVRALESRLLSLDVPTFVTGGNGFAGLLRHGWDTRPIKLNGNACLLFYRDAPDDLDIPDTAEALLGVLAARFGFVGDPCCGYGRSARAFARAGKGFVASDHNARCVGYIARHAPIWLTPGKVT